jgi:nitrite reductase (NO-forming)
MTAARRAAAVDERAADDGDGRDPALDGRVAAVHGQVRPTLLLAAGFALAAPAAAVVPHRTGPWLPLHLFLVGALLLAISGATQMFAVTWAAGPPAPDRLVAAQRMLLAGGVAGLALVREFGGSSALLVGAGSAVAVALALLAVALRGIVRRAVQRRFDVTWRWYRSALAVGGAGVGLGIALAAGTVSNGSTAPVRDAHVLLNVLGLVGFVIAGTLPFFVSTQARMRMSPRAGTGLQDGVRRILVTGLLLAWTGGLAGQTRLTGFGLLLYAAGLAALAGLLPRPGRRQLRWAGPRLLQLGCGLLWWFGSVLAMAVCLLLGDTSLPQGALLALVVGGYGQILMASLAYLGPVLRGGGHQRLAAGFAATASRGGLVLGNGAALALATGQRGVGAAVLALWLLDTAGHARALLSRGIQDGVPG